MPIPGSHTHGPWTLRKPHWSSPWVATHRDTGEVVDTGEHHVERAKDTLSMPDPADRPGYTPGARITLMPRRTRTTASPKGWDTP